VDVGPPTPANLLSVTITHLPARNDKKAMGRLMAEALQKKAKVHDVFAKYTIHPKLPNKRFFAGTYVASVQFLECPANEFPDTDTRETFPGWLEIRGIHYQVHYVGRMDHCSSCRASATQFHTTRDCNKAKCWNCGDIGHSKVECPKRDKNRMEDVEDGEPAPASDKKRKRTE